MTNTGPVTCQIQYRLDMTKLTEFEAYARAWIVLIERHGGTHHGCFLPRPRPDADRISFSDVGRDGPADVAIALFSFPNDTAYRSYREGVANDPDCGPAAALYRDTQCFISYERLFLRRLD